MTHDLPTDPMNLFAREKLGARPDSEWLKLEVLGDCKTPRNQTYFKLLMVVRPATTYRSGPRKGETNWKARDRSLDRELVGAFRDYDAFISERGL